MKKADVIRWLEKTLNVSAFDDVSNNGEQIERRGETVTTVAFAVDASVKAVEAAAKAGAQLLVVHHGISWGGGIRRLVGGVGEVVRRAFAADLGLFACHLPLDAHPTLGNNAQLAKLLGLVRVKRAFSYHGNVIGCVGDVPKGGLKPNPFITAAEAANVRRVGVCSGGAGDFAEEARNLGCDLFLTGEANWGEVIAAENAGARMICAGHYETEVWGVRALAARMKKELRLATIDLTASETVRK